MAQQALDTIGISLDLDAEVGGLSVSQKQIVAISRAILQNARLIIMDEPTTALTNKEIERLYEIIRGLSARGISVVFVSHKLDEVFAVCDRITVIRNGEIVADEYADKFEKENLVYYMTGERIAEEPFRYTGASQTPLLQVEKLCQKGAFEDISFSVFPGEILGITGQLGSGRPNLPRRCSASAKPPAAKSSSGGRNSTSGTYRTPKKRKSPMCPKTGFPKACLCSAA